MNFGLIGAAGYIAPRHMNAVHELGHQIVAAVDPHDCVGYMDRFFPYADFFTEIERFDRHLEKLRRGPEERRVQYVSICSPNYLHDAHVRLALRVKAHAICEKPLVLSPWNLDALAELEEEHERDVYAILQLRSLPSLIQLRESLLANTPRERAEVCLSYVTRRGSWYRVSWKGDRKKSGGVAMNIGIHFFDLLIWLFGGVESSEVHLSHSQKMAGLLQLERARVRWFLSTDERDLPKASREHGQYAHRNMTVNGQDLEFSTGFTDLHTEVYRQIIAGCGSRISDARPSIELVHQINNSVPVPDYGSGHPALAATSASSPSAAKAA
jgi:UDP-N-acetyl-2-amino-2-deoxyglucuronate dehydrogenase